MYMERCTQKVIGSYEQAVALEKKYDALEAKLGNVPPKRRYTAWYSGLPLWTFIWERDWESLTAIENYYKAIWEDPEWVETMTSTDKVFGDAHFELFDVFTLPE
jgi:hypothetical protein